MAGFEIVVRPVVFPDIRPRPAQSLPPQDDPDKGFALIHGNGGTSFSLSNSYSASTSSSKHSETKRQVDVARVYQMNDDELINRSNFVDIEVANKIWMKGPPSTKPGFNGDDLVPTTPGRGFTGDDIVPRSQGGKGDEISTHKYRRIKEKDNIEIKEENKIIRRDDK